MANRYVRSTDGSNADDGSTWALADLDLAGTAASDAAGDRIFLSQVHAESTAGAITVAIAGSVTAPSQIICGNDAAEPPTAVATTATVTTTGNSGITLSGWSYWYGIAFSCGTGAVSPPLTLGAGTEKMVFESCDFIIPSTGSTAKIVGGPNSEIEWLNCQAKFGATGQGISVDGEFVWRGGSIISGSTAVSALFVAHTTNRGVNVRVEGVDLSNLGSGLILATTNLSTDKYVFCDCKLPASWSGSLISSLTNPSTRVEMYNCDSGDTNYRLWVEDNAGNVKHETTIIRTGGASDGTTGLAWKMATGANAEYPLIKLETPEIVVWSDATGAKTVTVEIVHDSQGAGSGSKFQDDEIWLEVMYLGTSGFPLGTWIRDCKADVLATAANQADSTETWTTTGLATPVKQKLSVSITTAEKGFIHARVVMAKASKTAYICPKLTVA